MTFTGWFLDERTRVEEVRFDNGTTWDAATLMNLAASATEAADDLVGTLSDDTLDCFGGDDSAPHIQLHG